MKAIVWTKYGSPDGLKLKEIPKPVLKENSKNENSFLIF